jgi:hypothetical protein
MRKIAIILAVAVLAMAQNAMASEITGTLSNNPQYIQINSARASATPGASQSPSDWPMVVQIGIGIAISVLAAMVIAGTVVAAQNTARRARKKQV